MTHTSREQIPPLSKSRFMAGLQCHKRLYLELYQRELADPVGVAQQAIFDAGTEVGELARELYPGGVLITEDHFHLQEAVASTEKAISDTSMPAIFEAAFMYDDVRIRADVLVRAGEGQYDLIEVKSSTKVKEDHLPDVAVQLYVLEGCGIKVRRACLCHINKEYIYPGGGYDLNQLFSIEDVTGEARELQPDVPVLLEEMRSPLWEPEPPEVKTWRHCAKPYPCSFYGHCHEDESEHHISQLPGAREKLLLSLDEAGIENIRDIPGDFDGLNANQSRVRDCVVNDCVYMDTHLPKLLQALEYPIYFLDFETFNPALPLYAETKPYQIMPFQWSIHVLSVDGSLAHKEYLHDGLDDPREPLASSMLEALGESGAIVVYSSFEATRIRELAEALPHLSKNLLALRDGRIVDLLKIVRDYYYHPEFHGSFSIKSVLPALVSDLDYSDLEINEGQQASTAYAEMIRPETTADRRDELRKNLLAYCKRDTEAEVHLFNFLRQDFS